MVEFLVVVTSSRSASSAVTSPSSRAEPSGRGRRLTVRFLAR
jgi:hypothetical protein